MGLAYLTTASYFDDGITRILWWIPECAIFEVGSTGVMGPRGRRSQRPDDHRTPTSRISGLLNSGLPS